MSGVKFAYHMTVIVIDGCSGVLLIPSTLRSRAGAFDKLGQGSQLATHRFAL
jgi:hypothetical protein